MTDIANHRRAVTPNRCPAERRHLFQRAAASVLLVVRRLEGQAIDGYSRRSRLYGPRVKEENGSTQIDDHICMYFDGPK